MEADGAQLRRSAAIRVGVALLIAGGVTTLAILAQWGPLDVKTDVVGYPIFKDFNVENYLTGYYLLVGLFPLLSLGLFLGLTRLGPRFGLAAAPKSGPIRAPAPAPATGLEGEPALAEIGTEARWVVSAARLLAVGAVLGFAIGISSNALWWHGPLAGVVGYPVAVVVAGWLLRRAWRGEWPLAAHLAAANAVGGAASIAALLAVSLNTNVTIASTGVMHQFDWLPVWLGVPLLAAALGYVLVGLRRASSPDRPLAIERTTLLLVVVPVALVLLRQVMIGDLGVLEGFHFGELLEGATLVGDGWMPWRDVVLTHGLFQDVIYTYGRGVFGNSVWGFLMGTGMIMAPLYIVSVYFLLVYLLRRNWALLVFAFLLLLDPALAAEQFRMILWPPILLLLATVLDRPAGPRTALLGVLVVVQTILTPEAVPGVIAVGAVLIGCEWYRRRGSEPLADRYRRTIWFAGATTASALVFAVYLAARGALDDYVFLSINLVHGHALSGGMPPEPSLGTISTFAFDFLAIAPMVALLISFGYAVVMLRLRRSIRTEDWVMAAAAIFLLFYYPKFLARMDSGHLYQPFVVGIPLMLYIVGRAVDALDGAIRGWRPGRSLVRLCAHPASLVLVLVTVFLYWGANRDHVKNAPVFHHPVAAAPAEVKRVGYSQSFDTQAFRDLRRAVDAYLKPGEPVFDFSNTPLIVHYLMNRRPSTRYFHVAVAYPAKLQSDLIDRLERKKPKLIVFDNDGDPFIGLSNWDGIPSMVRLYEASQWILDRYRPVLWTHGFTLYARRDAPPPSRAGLDLAVPPVTSGVGFTVQPCTWGDIPNFLSGAGLPPDDARSVSARARPALNQATVIGWAGDPNAKEPARQVIATVDGRVVGRIQPKLPRPDLVAFGLPEGFRQAGFQMQFPVPPGKDYKVYGVSRNGRLSELVAKGQKPEKGATEIEGRTTTVDAKSVYGQINSATRTNAVKFSLPAGSSWDDYRWLEVESGGDGFAPATFTVYDKQSRPTQEREISFDTLDDSPNPYVVPVGSCSQWHSYRSGHLYLNFDHPQDISAVRLIR